MDSTIQTSSKFQHAIETNYLYWDSGLLIFVIGVFVLSWMVKNHNGFNFVETVMATIGLKKFKRTIGINIVHAITIIIPLSLMLYAVMSYEGT